jgi:hypothetical protein
MATATATPAGFLTARSVILIALSSLPEFCVCFKIGRKKYLERYQSIFITGEIRAFIQALVVTKVMYCGDLLRAGGKPSQEEGQPTKKRQWQHLEE